MGDDLFQNSSQARSLTPNVSQGAGFSGPRLDIMSAISGLFFWLLVFVGVLLIVWLVLNFIRRRNYNIRRNKEWNNTVFIEVAVPKETAEQVQKEVGQNKNEKDMIAVGEQLFSIMSEYAKEDWKTWLFGNERFSLEIVNIEKEIRFWLVCSDKTADVIERQVIAIYPRANVHRLTKIDFFKENTVAHSQELVLSNRFELPFKTFRLTDGDPLNAITNAMEGLTKEESAAVQLVITPIKDSWHRKPRILATKIQQGQNPKDVLNPKFNGFEFITKILNAFVDALFKGKDDKPDMNQGKKERQLDLTGRYQQLQLTPQHQELIKKLEEKSSKPGFRFTLRVVGSALTEVRAKQIVDGIIPAFQIYDIRPFNGFKKKNTDVKNSMLNFLMRVGNLDQNQILNTEEICSIWHLPNYLVNTPNIKWLLARKPPIPLEIPPVEPGNVFLGVAKARGQSKDVYMKPDDRFRHIYSLGGSGSGKSVLMTNIVLQDIQMGNGVCVVDPHGNTVDDILMRMPEDRIDDVIVFAPSITDRPLGLNMLETDPAKPAQKTLVIDMLFTIWDKLYDLKKTGGPMFENYMKNSMRLVMAHPESGCTLMEIAKVLSDEDFRSFKLAMCDEVEVVDFWEKEATKAGGEASLENMVPYITSKLAPFVTNDFLKPMIGQQKSAINFRTAMDNRKIILVKLEKGLIGENSAYLVGMVILGNLLMAGMGRNDFKKYNLDGTMEDILLQDQAPFYVYIDEMQNFLFDAIPKALEEIRKYKVGFYLAHQFVKQVIVDGSERIKDSIMANCASKFIFRCSADDASYLEKEFGPTLTAADIANPEKYTYNAILLVDGQRTTPFNINSFPLSKDIDPDRRKRIIDKTKEKYGKDREQVEQEIKDRAKLLF